MCLQSPLRRSFPVRQMVAALGLAFTFSVVPAHAQGDSSDRKVPPPHKSHFTEIPAQDLKIEDAVFATRAGLPDVPKPNVEQVNEDSACPSGPGEPCALIGGVRQYGDPWHFSIHEKTWWDSMKTPSVLFSTGALLGATVLDLQGTQSCIANHQCVESNPLLREHTLGEKYAVALPIDALVTWTAVREKQHGRGVLPFCLSWAFTTVHLAYGIEGFRNASPTH